MQLVNFMIDFFISVFLQIISTDLFSTNALLNNKYKIQMVVSMNRNDRGQESYIN